MVHSQNHYKRIQMLHELGLQRTELLHSCNRASSTFGRGSDSAVTGVHCVNITH